MPDNFDKQEMLREANEQDHKTIFLLEQIKGIIAENSIRLNLSSPSSSLSAFNLLSKPKYLTKLTELVDNQIDWLNKQAKSTQQKNDKEKFEFQYRNEILIAELVTFQAEHHQLNTSERILSEKIQDFLTDQLYNTKLYLLDKTQEPAQRNNNLQFLWMLRNTFHDSDIPDEDLFYIGHVLRKFYEESFKVDAVNPYRIINHNDLENFKAKIIHLFHLYNELSANKQFKYEFERKNDLWSFFDSVYQLHIRKVSDENISKLMQIPLSYLVFFSSSADSMSSEIHLLLIDLAIKDDCKDYFKFTDCWREVYGGFPDHNKLSKDEIFYFLKIIDIFNTDIKPVYLNHFIKNFKNIRDIYGKLCALTIARAHPTVEQSRKDALKLFFDHFDFWVNFPRESDYIFALVFKLNQLIPNNKVITLFKELYEYNATNKKQLFIANVINCLAPLNLAKHSDVAKAETLIDDILSRVKDRSLDEKIYTHLTSKKYFDDLGNVQRMSLR